MIISKSRDTFYVYVLKCKYGTFYTGWTNNLKKRITAHNEGKGAKYLRGRGPVRLMYQEQCSSLREVLARERAIKKLTRKQKEVLLR